MLELKKKVDEVKKHFNIKTEDLSVALGKSRSHLYRVLKNGVTTKTKNELIVDLDKLLVDGLPKSEIEEQKQNVRMLNMEVAQLNDDNAKLLETIKEQAETISAYKVALAVANDDRMNQLDEILILNSVNKDLKFWKIWAWVGLAWALFVTSMEFVK